MYCRYVLYMICMWMQWCTRNTHMYTKWLCHGCRQCLWTFSLSCDSHGGFHKWGHPKISGLQWKILFKMDDLGLPPYFREPPYGHQMAAFEAKKASILFTGEALSVNDMHCIEPLEHTGWRFQPGHLGDCSFTPETTQHGKLETQYNVSKTMS